jgi:hypothetical protein
MKPIKFNIELLICKTEKKTQEQEFLLNRASKILNRGKFPKN